MRLVIVTGMSGAGRTTALKVLEDAGYFCVDNLPVPFIDKFAELTASGNSEITKVAIGIDIRSGKSSPLKNITSNYHYHKVAADSEETLDLIEEALRQKHFLVS